MTSSNGNIFRVTGPLCGEFTGPPVNSPHKGQWRGALMLSLICVWINDWGNNREAGDLRRYRTHYDVIVMWWTISRNNTVFLYIYIIAYTMKLLIHSKTSMLKRRTVPKGGNWHAKWPQPALFERGRGFCSNYRAILKSIVILSRFCKRKWSLSSSLNAKMNT